MGSYGWAKLTIGGRGPRHELFKALALHAGAVPRDLKRGDDSGGVRWELHDGGPPGKVLVIEADEASYGRFSELEEALVKLEVAWDRQSDPVAEFPAMFQQFRPGLGLSEDANAEGTTVMISATEVRAKLAEGGPTLLLEWMDQVAPAFPELEPLDLQT